MDGKHGFAAKMAHLLGFWRLLTIDRRLATVARRAKMTE
jgi:hypothetical protein